MFAIGCHLSISKGYTHMGAEALSLGANTFQFFTRNPRGGKMKDIDIDDAAGLKKIMQDNHFPVIMAHAPYTMNLCSSKVETRLLGEEMMRGDLQRMELFIGNMYNFHPGSHGGQGIETGVRQIADSLNRILAADWHTIILLETMSGKGSEVGARFEELRQIIDLVKRKDRVGVCLDTCHVFDAGYDIVNNLDGVISEFDKVIGLEKLKAIHLNDSKNPCGSHKDRHEKLGKGHIGAKTLRQIVTHPFLMELPFFLETPNEPSGYRREISIVKEWRTGLKIKRAYESPEKSDGKRILVDYLWPRGVKKENLNLTNWWKDIAPSNDLRKWFGHEPEKYSEFREKYRRELEESPKTIEYIEEIRNMLTEGPVTLIYAAKNQDMNNAVVLCEWILEKI